MIIAACWLAVVQRGYKRQRIVSLIHYFLCEGSKTKNMLVGDFQKQQKP